LTIGVALQTLILLYEQSFPSIYKVGLHNDTHFVDFTRFPAARSIPGITIVRMEESLAFYNANYFLDKIREILQEAPKVIIIDASTIARIDGTGAFLLSDLIYEINNKTTTVLYIAGATEQVYSVLESSGLAAKLSNKNIFISVKEAVNSIEIENNR